MEVFNILDEQDRIKRIEFIYTDRVGQYDSHGMSYLAMRDFLKKHKTGEAMGIDRLVLVEEDMAHLEELRDFCGLDIFEDKAFKDLYIKTLKQLKEVANYKKRNGIED